MDSDELERLLHRAGDLAVRTLSETVSRLGGERDGQYDFDLQVDGPLVDMLLGAGLGVLSEEAGAVELDRPLVAVLDPVDGSTNAAHGLPWYATSICVVDDDGPLYALVVDHASGVRWEARRGHGATRNGEPLGAPPRRELSGAVIGVNGLPPASPGWAQFRALGASALDLCAVAGGLLDGYVDFDENAHGVWDYLGGLLVCREAGIEVVDAGGRDLVVLDHAARRTPVAAASESVRDALVVLRAGER